MSLQAFYIAAAAVALLQFVRLRDKRLIALVLLFLCLGVAHIQGEWFAARPWHYLAGVSGLVLVVMIPRRSS